MGTLEMLENRQDSTFAQVAIRHEARLEELEAQMQEMAGKIDKATDLMVEVREIAVITKTLADQGKITTEALKEQTKVISEMQLTMQQVSCQLVDTREDVTELKQRYNTHEAKSTIDMGSLMKKLLIDAILVLGGMGLTVFLASISK